MFPADNPIFYKVETYLDRFLVPEMYEIPNFVKIVWAVLEIYKISVHGQNDRQIDIPIIYKSETYLGRFLVLEIYIIPIFVKIVRAALEIVNIYIPTNIYTILARLIISGDTNFSK